LFPSEADRDWFIATLRTELQRLGSTVAIEHLTTTTLGADAHHEVLDPLQIEWIEIPSGQFIMGNEEEDRERPQHGYWIPEGFKGWRDGRLRTKPYDFGEPFTLANHPIVAPTSTGRIG